MVKLRVPKSKIIFSRPNSTDGLLDIYTINADGTGLKYLYKANPQEWLNKAAQNTVFADMVDQYPGYTEYNGKKVKLERSPTSEKLILLDNKKQIILKQSQGFFSTLGINSFKWMSDGRHLLIEDNEKVQTIGGELVSLIQ